MADIHLLSVGQVVFSKCGRDKGLPFIIIELDDDYVFLADGGLRKLSNPKKKKLRHLQPVNHIDETLKNKISERQDIADIDLKNALEPFRRRRDSNNN